VTLIIGVITAAVALGVLVTGVSVRERAEMRRSLRALEGYQITGVRDQEMLAGFGARVLEPLGNSLRDWVRRVTPDGYMETVKRKVVLAGNPPGVEVDRLLVLKIVGTASPIVWFPLVYIGLEMTGFLALAITGFLCAISFLGADLAIDNKIEARKLEIARRLPDMLDLLVISVEAGLGFEQALDRTANSVPGPLSDEFRRMLQETRIGATRSDARRCARRAHRRARAAVVHPGDAPGRHLRCVGGAHLALTGGGDAGPSAACGAGTGAEGAGEDAVPARCVHLPCDFHRGARAGVHRHLAEPLTVKSSRP